MAEPSTGAESQTKRRCYIAFCVLVVVAGYVAVINPFRPSFVKAKITVHQLLRHPHINASVSIVIEDAYVVRELSAYLPRVGQYLFVPLAGGWATGVLVELYAEDGETVVVSISDDLRDFNDGNGDGSVRAGFNEFLMSLLDDGRWSGAALTYR